MEMHGRSRKTPLLSGRDELRLVSDGRFYGEEHNPQSFLLALCQFLKKYPEMKLHVTFVGDFPADAMGLLRERADLSGAVRVLPYQPMRNVIKLLNEADWALWFVDSKASSEGHVPARIFEYLYVGKPVLCISAANNMPAFVNQESVGIAVLNSPERIMEGLRRIRLQKRGEETFPRVRRLRYSRRQFLDWFRLQWSAEAV